MPPMCSSVAHLCNVEGSRCGIVFSNYLLPWYYVVLKPLNSYIRLSISIPFFSVTFPQPVNSWIEWKLVLDDFVRKYGWPSIKIYSIIILLFLWSFSIGKWSGTLGMFYMWPGSFQTDFTLRMPTWGPKKASSLSISDTIMGKICGWFDFTMLLNFVIEGNSILSPNERLPTLLLTHSPTTYIR